MFQAASSFIGGILSALGKLYYITVCVYRMFCPSGVGVCYLFGFAVVSDTRSRVTVYTFSTLAEMYSFSTLAGVWLLACPLSYPPEGLGLFLIKAANTDCCPLKI